MKQLKHLPTGENQNHVFKREYLGEGRYYQRGICQGIEEGDMFWDFLDPKRELKVDKIISLEDSQGIYPDPKQKEKALYKAELIDPDYENEQEYELVRLI